MLTICILLGIVPHMPITSLAENGEMHINEDVVEEWEVLPVPTDKSGTCGENLTWKLDDNGTLTISGTGEMYDFGAYGEGNPWFNFRYDVVNIVIENGVTSIGENAFWGFSNLTAVSMPKSVKSIGKDAFYGCSDFSDIEDSIENEETEEPVPVPTDKSGACGENLTWKLDDNGTLTISGTGEMYDFGAYGEGNPWFNFCYDVVNIVIENGVTSIGENAFWGFSNLTAVSMPKSVKRIGYWAFGMCESLTSIDIPDSVTNIEYGAFIDCRSLTNIVIPNGIKSIENNLFTDCISLTSITIPDSVTSIGGSSFAGCTGLKNINIPNNVKSIEDYAFSGCSSLISINIPKNVTSIGNSAFRECNSLLGVEIPDSVTNIEQDAFYKSNNVEFYCNMNSYAAIYAIENKIPIHDLGTGSNDDMLSVKRKNTYYKVNNEGISASGYLPMVLNYEFKSGVNPKSVEITVRIPENVELVEETLYLNGELCVQYNYESNLLTIPVTEKKGDLKFQLKPLSYEPIFSYAKIFFVEIGKNGEDVCGENIIGVIDLDIPILSITTQGETGQSMVEVKGVTLPNHSVDLYVDGVKQSTVVSNKAGDYSAKLTLANPSSGKKYVLMAKTTDKGGNAITAETRVIYKEATPVLTTFIMEHNGARYTLEDTVDKKPIVTFTGGADFKFTVKFEPINKIDKVFIISTRNNTKKYMEAKWDEKEQAYIAKGFFEPENTSYVPGTIGVTYERTSESIDLNTPFDFSADEVINSIPDDWKNPVIEVENVDDDSVGATVKVEEKDGSITEIRYTKKKKENTQNITVDNAEEHGFVCVSKTDKEMVFSKIYNYQDPTVETLVFLEKEGTSSAVETGYTLFSYEVDSIGIKVAGKSLGVVKYAELIDDTVSTEQAYREMEREIRNSAVLSEEEKDKYCEVLSWNRALNGICIVGRWFGGAVEIAGSIAEKSKVLEPIGKALQIEAKLCDFLFKSLQNEAMIRQNNNMFTIQNMKFDFRWAIDPSGYVYDSITNERIQGVKATVYFKETLESASILWDASEYSQKNPLYTDKDGKYAWDVPEGFWQVKYEHSDYETAYSEWLQVPPPQTDVNVGMIPLNIPQNKIYYHNISRTIRVLSDTEYKNSALVIALYDDNKKLIQLKTKTTDINNGTTDIVLEDFETDDGNKVKVMLWNGMTNIIPLLDNCEVLLN